jgi:hypothetical protein
MTWQRLQKLFGKGRNRLGDEFYGSHGDAEEGEVHDDYPYKVVGIASNSNLPVSFTQEMVDEWLNHNPHRLLSLPEIAKLLPGEVKTTTQCFLHFSSAFLPSKTFGRYPSWNIRLPVWFVCNFETLPVTVTDVHLLAAQVR